MTWTMIDQQFGFDNGGTNMATMKMNSRADIEREVIVRAWRDAEFRETLLANPKEALSEYFQCDFENEINVHIHQEDGHNIHIRIPEIPSSGVGASNGAIQIMDDPDEIMNPLNQTGPPGSAYTFCTVC
jgi:hypothetical protein